MSNIFEKHMADKSYDDYVLRRNASLCVNATINGEESEDVLEALAAVLVEIHRAPAADVAPVAHGRWEFIDYYYGEYSFRCSVCGYEQDEKSKFCPHCGAKMDESEGKE